MFSIHASLFDVNSLSHKLCMYNQEWIYFSGHLLSYGAIASFFQSVGMGP